jgi:hypothetical protein
MEGSCNLCYVMVCENSRACLRSHLFLLSFFGVRINKNLKNKKLIVISSYNEEENL